MTKAQILSEIRRTAATNGGKPLGAAAFSRETGVQERAWLGKHWARWGDALQEAGYAANTLNQPLSDSHVLDHLARAVLELGRWPTHPELKLRRKNDPTMPSHNVFTRLGRKAELARKLQTYCKSKSEYAAVAAVCAGVLSTEPVIDAEAQGGSVASTGHVYLIKYGRHYKIGRTNSTSRRHREISIELPNDTKLVHSIETDDPSGIEAYWHQRFADRRHKGEWFNLTLQDIAAFRRRRFQ
jgi:hypothetical protein